MLVYELKDTPGWKVLIRFNMENPKFFYGKRLNTIGLNLHKEEPQYSV
jgi:hypothetical protein